MTANPLMRRAEPTFDPIEKLHNHVAELNRHNWVRTSGKAYFVGKRIKADSSIEYFVDRQSVEPGA
jgi:hypothetical protein